MTELRTKSVATCQGPGVINLSNDGLVSSRNKQESRTKQSQSILEQRREYLGWFWCVSLFL